MCLSATIRPAVFGWGYVATKPFRNSDDSDTRRFIGKYIVGRGGRTPGTGQRGG
jgi:hypothetical protein